MPLMVPDSWWLAAIWQSMLVAMFAPWYNPKHMNRTKHLVLVVIAVLTLGVMGGFCLSADVYAAPAMQDQPCRAGDACESFFENYINPIVTLLTVSIGVIAAISLVVAGIQYGSAGNDPGKVQKAKHRMGQTLLGVLAYLFLFAFLNYIVPGGFLG